MHDEFYMQQAYKEAVIAYNKGEIPVGAVVVVQDKIIARAHNQTEQLLDVTAHAEILAVTGAANYLGAKYLNQCTMYVTLEPCVMCAGAIAWSQLGRLVFGAYDVKRGFSRIESATEGTNNKVTKLLHPKTLQVGGVLENECAELLQRFFQKLRN
ncbi:nucleoside deaminase [Microscilla marina]|uniref:tRNA-specific adenosine deaminase n=1 Tax=Microscilla marina ATCC 23134 TaxID=313606 RepID=A1ZTZ1_MICM2|nr:nucleoside deaminase [Microscilla marina]EAY26104.1 cytosine deaminase [Microscilla marina ATCC 23134]